MLKILVLGGYGNFGKRIVEILSHMDTVEIVIAGRNAAKAKALIAQLEPLTAAKLTPLVIDIQADSFQHRLNHLQPHIVIHTSGPFQGQDYMVPQACLHCGCHYIDLADDSRYVGSIGKLQAQAKDKGILLVTGASSVPGLSAAVIDYYRHRFSQIDHIDIAIAPGNKAERGAATVKGILSYTGHPFDSFTQGKLTQVYGWMNPRRLDFSGVVGKRWLANVDVPDLTLFPRRYQVTGSVRFQAGLELPFLHLSLVAMAFLAKIKWVKNWAKFTKPIVSASDLLRGFGSDSGAMQVVIKGKSLQGMPYEVQWTLYAPNGQGPFIPTLSAVIVAKKLLTAEISETGAKPCLDLFQLTDFIPYFESLGISFTEKVQQRD